MSETLRDVAVDLAKRLAAAEANSAYDGFAAWERRGEYLHEYMDRINAADAERTCHPVAMDNFNETDGDGEAWAVCSECGRVLAVLSDGDGMPCFCPACGARVVDGDE